MSYIGLDTRGHLIPPDFHGPLYCKQAEIQHFHTFVDSVKRGKAIFDSSTRLKDGYNNPTNLCIYHTVKIYLEKVVKYLENVQRNGKAEDDYMAAFVSERWAEAAWVACGLVKDLKGLELIEARRREADPDADEEIAFYPNLLALCRDGVEFEE